MLKLLPKGIGGSDNSGQSFILETSVVDVKEGWMETESRNMEWTGILSVIEKQLYRRSHGDGGNWNAPALDIDGKKGESTAVKTTVIFESRLGQTMLGRAKKAEGQAEDAGVRGGFLASWSTAGIQRTIELIGVKRTKDAVFRSKQGMNVVLERLRHGGVVAVVEGMRHDRDGNMGHNGPWKRAWLHGVGEGSHNSNNPALHIDHGDDD